VWRSASVRGQSRIDHSPPQSADPRDDFRPVPSPCAPVESRRVVSPPPGQGRGELFEGTVVEDLEDCFGGHHSLLIDRPAFILPLCSLTVLFHADVPLPGSLFDV